MLEELKVEAGSHVLDAGCGPSVHSIRAARLGARVLGIDVSQTALDEAKRRVDRSGVGERVELRRQDLTHLDLASGSFSAVFCWGVVIHVPEIEKALEELARVLAPGSTGPQVVSASPAWIWL